MNEMENKTINTNKSIKWTSSTYTRVFIKIPITVLRGEVTTKKKKFL